LEIIEYYYKEGIFLVIDLFISLQSLSERWLIGIGNNLGKHFLLLMLFLEQHGCGTRHHLWVGGL